jgi:hypothetical protein
MARNVSIFIIRAMDKIDYNNITQDFLRSENKPGI